MFSFKLLPPSLALSVLCSVGLCPSYDAVFYSWVLVCSLFLVSWSRCICLLGPFCVLPAPICLFLPDWLCPGAWFGICGGLFLFLQQITIEIRYNFLKKLNLALCRLFICLCQNLPFSCPNGVASLPYFFEPFELLLEHNYLNYLIDFSTITNSHMRQSDHCGHGVFLCSPWRLLPQSYIYPANNDQT